MTIKAHIRLIIATLCLVFAPCAANAAYQPLSCNGYAPQGDLLDADSACQYSGIEHIFSQVLCNFITVLNYVMDNVYCGMQYGLKSAVAAAITVYIMIFGFQILTGTAHLGAGEILKRFVKIGIIWLLSTDSTWAVGLCLRFFMSFITEGAQWVTAPTIGTYTPTSIFTFLDAFLFNFTVGPLLKANGTLIGFFLMLLIVLPIIGMMAFYWLYTTAVVLAQTLFGLCSCFTVITFLLSMISFFASTFLFPQTQHLGEGYGKYMMSFSLRMVIRLGILGMWVLTMNIFVGWFNQVSELIFIYTPALVEEGLVSPDIEYGICPYKTGYDMLGPTIDCKKANFNPKTSKTDRDAVIGPGELVEEGDFIYYMVYHLATLILVSYAFKKMMEHADTLADAIVGPAYIPALGGGWHGIDHYIGNGPADPQPPKGAPGSGADNPLLAKATRAASSFTDAAHHLVGTRPKL